MTGVRHDISPDQTARAILRVLVRSMQLRVGNGVLLELLDQHARGEGVGPNELWDGLMHAHRQGWVVYDNYSACVRLTKAGLAVAGPTKRGH